MRRAVHKAGALNDCQYLSLETGEQQCNADFLQTFRQQHDHLFTTGVDFIDAIADDYTAIEP